MHITDIITITLTNNNMEYWGDRLINYYENIVIDIAVHTSSCNNHYEK